MMFSKLRYHYLQTDSIKIQWWKYIVSSYPKNCTFCSIKNFEGYALLQRKIIIAVYSKYIVCIFLFLLFLRIFLKAIEKIPKAQKKIPSPMEKSIR